MSYLVCEECGKCYELDEGKSSFSYEKCDCGGKLTYTDSLNEIKNNHHSINKSIINSKITCSNCGAENPVNTKICSNCGDKLKAKEVYIFNKPSKGGISWLGIAAGFGFLLAGSLFSVIAIFGTNIPTKPENIPYNFLLAFGIIAMVLAIISGLISSYVGGSIKFKNGIINGGLVGVILGILVGLTCGSMVFLAVIAIFGSLSVLGGIFGTILKRRL